MKLIGDLFLEGGCTWYQNGGKHRQVNLLTSLIYDREYPALSSTQNEYTLLLLAVSAGQCWSCLQNNNNNQYYLSLADGSYNNNNKYNQYWVIPVESKEVLTDLIFNAEADCWKNKHSSWDACRFHYQAGQRIFKLIDKLDKGVYKPEKAQGFIIKQPKPREIFASFYQDRILHHVVSHFIEGIAEQVHRANGNVSFGNRRGVSFQHAAWRFQELMKKHPNGYVVTFDIKGFFMSINKQKLWDVFKRYAEKYKSKSISEARWQFYMALVQEMIFYDPTINCIKRSTEKDWRLIPPHKSLFFTHGLPIGNDYSQRLANLFLGYICEALIGEDIVEFVDDFGAVTDTMEDVNRIERKFRKAAEEIGLQINYSKKYIQKVSKGVVWCGFCIRPDRNYISNRTLKRCKAKINQFLSIKEPTVQHAIKFQQSINSYFGMMRWCATYKIENEIIDKIRHSQYRPFLWFKHDVDIHPITGERIIVRICQLKSKCKPKWSALQSLAENKITFQKLRKDFYRTGINSIQNLL